MSWKKYIKEKAVMGASLTFHIEWSEKIPSNEVICHQIEKYVRKLAIQLLREVCSGREKSKIQRP